MTETKDAIVRAASRLLAEQGARAVTTRAVAELAGVQGPTIYRLFGDKDGLVDAVAESVMAAYVAAKTEQLDRTGDPVEELRAGWRMQVEFGLANPELYTLLATRTRPGSSPATDAGVEVLRDRVRRLAAAGLLRVDEPRAVQMIHAAGSGTVLALLNAPEDERDAGLPDAMFDALCAGILTTGGTAPGDGPHHVAVTFAGMVPHLPGLTDAERALMSEWLTRANQADRR